MTNHSCYCRPFHCMNWSQIWAEYTSRIPLFKFWFSKLSDIFDGQCQRKLYRQIIHCRPTSKILLSLEISHFKQKRIQTFLLFQAFNWPFPFQLMVALPILMNGVDLQRMSGGAIGLLDRLSEVLAAAKLQLAARQGVGRTFLVN